MTLPSDPSLRVRRMHVLWRDTFIAERSLEGAHRPHPDFLAASRERLCDLPCYVADSRSERSQQPDLLRVIERASRNVARIGYDSLNRFQFVSFNLANLKPTLSRLRCPPDALPVKEVETAAREADELAAWIEVTPMLLLHRAGVGVVEYLATWHDPDEGYTPDEAIELVRLGISAQLLGLPDAWCEMLPANYAEWAIHCLIDSAPDWHLAVGGLRDLSQILIASLQAPLRPRRAQGRRKEALLDRPTRPTGSTTVVLEEINPLPGAELAAFVRQNAGPLRGIGAMDTYYRERAGWIVERELADNLSVDSESAVYLLGNSELVVFNDQLPPVVESSRRRLGLPSDDLVVTYLYMHYQVLMEWTYLQDAILRAYIQRLDALASSPAPRRSAMIATLQGALADLIQYQENITPFATRVEFLERAGAYHKLNELAGRFERKQAMLLNYASEFHDYREARATEFLNWLAGILTGASLANLIITLAGIRPEQTTLYLGITLGSILVVLAILAAVQRFL